MSGDGALWGEIWVGWAVASVLFNLSGDTPSAPRTRLLVPLCSPFPSLPRCNHHPKKTTRVASRRRLSKVVDSVMDVWFIRGIVICQADCLGVTGTRLGEDSHEKNSPICRVGHSCSPHALGEVAFGLCWWLQANFPRNVKRQMGYLPRPKNTHPAGDHHGRSIPQPGPCQPPVWTCMCVVIFYLCLTSVTISFCSRQPTHEASLPDSIF